MRVLLICLGVAHTRTKRLEGKMEKIGYFCTGKSALQVRRNTEQALRAAGFTLDFTGYDLPVHYITGHKGGLWIGVEASETGGDSTYKFTSVLVEGTGSRPRASWQRGWAIPSRWRTIVPRKGAHGTAGSNW